ncbi:MAG TPA: hypothetical protein CFH81_04760 [Sulfurovum sp. UBA12169]|nr:MAG TPA: hypothetical protein CFH81_04760 [Sulfurovum sp. UBA12169]
MKNAIVGVLAVVIFASMAYVASNGRAYHGGEASKGFGAFQDSQQSASATPEGKDDRDIEQEELRSLKEKAGNINAFKVSDNYKSKCASCHGVNGEGTVGPKLIGQTSEEIYNALIEFKSGRKENTVMKGLLLSLTEEDLKEFADEIGEFPARAEAQRNQQ